MSPTYIAVLVCVCVFGAALTGVRLRTMLPQDHLRPETQDLVRMAMGLVATMTALVLGLLVTSAKSAYDTQRNGLAEMAAKVAFIDRVLAIYGPETAEARTVLRGGMVAALARVWPGKRSAPTDLAPNTSRGAELYESIERLSPQGEAQRMLRSQAFTTAADLAQMQWLLFEQASSSIATAILAIVIFWLALLFLSFGLFTPLNGTAITALVVSALSVSAALFLILELDQPFSGLIAISNEPILKVLKYLGH